MAIYSHRKRTTTRHEWVVPVNTNHGEFGKAYVAAGLAYREAHGLDRGAELYDDALWIDANDEEIVIYFTTEGDASA